MPLRLSIGVLCITTESLLRVTLYGIKGSLLNKNLPAILIEVGTPFSIIVGETENPEITVN
jgi:hypothetical protein